MFSDNTRHFFNTYMNIIKGVWRNLLEFRVSEADVNKK